MKKIIATGAAIAFAATLSSCELKKEEKNNEKASTPVVNQEADIPAANTEIPGDTALPESPDLNNAPEANTQPKTPSQEDPRMKLFQEKQEKMGKLFKDFEKNTPEFKPLQDQINAIFSSGKQPTEEDMKKVEELDGKIRALYTPEMKALDAELKQMGDEIFGQQNNTPESAPAEPENNENQNQVNPSKPTPESAPAEPEPATETGTGEQPMMILK